MRRVSSPCVDTDTLLFTSGLGRTPWKILTVVWIDAARWAAANAFNFSVAFAGLNIALNRFACLIFHDLTFLVAQERPVSRLAYTDVFW